MADYLSLFLFGLFNPTVRTMRGLCAISRVERVQQEVCSRAVSLGSFSEAQHLLDPALLEPILSELAQEVAATAAPARWRQWEWLARDSSLFRALPRMHWALYGGGKAGAPNRAVRLHVSLKLLEDTPEEVAVRAGKVCERSVWRQHWKAGQAYVGDRYFAEDYRAFEQLSKLGCAYVLRLRDQAVITIERDLSLSQADEQAGVLRQAWVRLGGKANRSAPVRLLWVKTGEGNTLLLVTNLSVQELCAGWVWLLYKRRWQVELFFRWIKCVLRCRHWLAESQAGATIQMYLALIAGLLLQLFTGRRPNKRMMELIQMHQHGWVTDEELTAGLRRQYQQMAQLKKN